MYYDALSCWTQEIDGFWTANPRYFIDSVGLKKEESTQKCISFYVSQCHGEMFWALENQDILFFLVCLFPSPEQWLIWKSQGSGWLGPKRIKANRVLDLCLGIAELVLERFSGPSNGTKLHRNWSTDQILQKLVSLDVDSL